MFLKRICENLSGINSTPLMLVVEVAVAARYDTTSPPTYDDLRVVYVRGDGESVCRTSSSRIRELPCPRGIHVTRIIISRLPTTAREAAVSVYTNWPVCLAVIG